jgi:hypothetical protein
MDRGGVAKGVFAYKGLTGNVGVLTEYQLAFAGVEITYCIDWKRKEGVLSMRH